MRMLHNKSIIENVSTKPKKYKSWQSQNPVNPDSDYGQASSTGHNDTPDR